MTGRSCRRPRKIVTSLEFMSANIIGAPNERIERRIFGFFACGAVLLHLLDGENWSVEKTAVDGEFGKQMFLSPNIQARREQRVSRRPILYELHGHSIFAASVYRVGNKRCRCVPCYTREKQAVLFPPRISLRKVVSPRNKI
jgi:hypothetical protein